MNEHKNDGRTAAANPRVSETLVRIVPAKPETPSGYTLFTGLECIMPNGEVLPGVTRIALTGEHDSLWHARIDMDIVPPELAAVATFAAAESAVPSNGTYTFVVSGGKSGQLRRIDVAPGEVVTLAPDERVVSTPPRELAIEAEVQAKGLTAPRVTPADVDAVIVGEYFHVPPGTTLTLCVLTLRNGFTVTGECACASPENFDADLGRNVSRANARQKVFMLEGYALRERLMAAAAASP